MTTTETEIRPTFTRDTDGRYRRHDGRVGEAVSGSSGGSYSSRSRESDGAYAQGGSYDVSGQWRDGSYGEVRHYTGRNASGYLVWPGKTERDDTPVQ